MNKLYLGVMALSFLFITNILSMEEQVADDTAITLVSQDNQKIRQEYGLLKRSKTIKDIIDDTQEGGVVKVEIPVPNVLAKDWIEIVGLLKMNETNLKKDLEGKSIQQLANLINNVNYLDIPSIFEPTIEIIANKIKTSPKLVCNQKSISKVENANELCNNAIHINIPFLIEKKIVKKMTPTAVAITHQAGLDSVNSKNITSISEQKLEILGDTINGYILTTGTQKLFITNKKESNNKNKIVIRLLKDQPKIIYEGDYNYKSGISAIIQSGDNQNTFYVFYSLPKIGAAIDVYTIGFTGNTIIEAQNYLRTEKK